jgi:hypothetical protein
MSGHGTGARGAAEVAAPPDANPNLLPLRVAGPARGYGNLFGPLAARNRYSVNGLIKPDGTIDAADRKKLHNRMAQLAHRIRKEPAINYGQAPVGEGAPMPSGYTYLLQFIAHDMVDTTQSMTVSGNQLEFAFANTRARSLCLDTIYGPGPDEAPHAYQPTDDDGRRPRTRLRIEGAPADAPIRGRCLRGDIGRAVNPDSALNILKVAIGEALKPKYDNDRTEETVDRIANDTACNWTTQPLIADPRNDAHALMSQMTVLFHRLHNAVMDIVDPLNDPSQGRTLEKVYRRFLCARTAVTLIYREIILKDVLERVLYRPVYQHYIRDRKPLCAGGDAIPIEFSHGAFRFGHAMVREEYQVNHRVRRPIELSEAMVQTSARPGASPVSGSWIVDWSRFFFDVRAAASADEVRNFSMGICPREGKAFEQAFESKNQGEDWKGLAARDLLTSCYAGLWSVPKLMARLRRDRSKLPQLEPQHLDFNGFWKPAIRDWLGQHNYAGENFRPTEWPRIAADPPLPFFVMYEAKQVCNGLRLGPIGSIILAETFRAAIERTPLAEPSDLGLPVRLKNCAAALLPDKPGVLDGLADSRIESMPQLLDFLASQNAFVGA